MRQTMQIIMKCLGILLLGAGLGALLLTGAFLLPVNEGYVEESCALLESEGWYPAVPMLSRSLDTYFHSFLPGVLDNGTDSVMFDTATKPEGENALVCAMGMRGYSYYWHGYVSILRPLLLLCNYGEIRVINHILQMLLLIVLGVNLWKRKRNIGYILALLSSYILLMPMAVGMSLQFSWVFYIAVAGAILFVRGKQWEQEGRYIYLFLILGMLTSYFDLLTYPLITWGMPLLWWLAVSPDETNGLYRLKRVFVTGISWIAGYALMWVMKWLIGSIVLGENIFESALYEVFFRAGVEEKLTFMARLEAIYTNWKHYEYKIYACVLVLWLLCGIVRSICRGWGKRKNSYAYLLIGFSSIVWYLVLANHTRGHHFFTYRIFAVSILAFMLIVTECTGIHENRKISLRTMLGWVGMAFLSLGMAYLAREELFVTNGGVEYRLEELAESVPIETEFTPSFSNINSFGLCLQSEASEGAVSLVLTQDETAVWAEEIALESSEDSSLRTIDVDWKLQAGRAYRLEIALRHSDAPVYALVSTQEGGLAEYSGLTIGNDSMQNQLLTAINYRSAPFSKKTIIFLAFTWMGILGSIMVVLQTILESLGWRLWKKKG